MTEIPQNEWVQGWIPSNRWRKSKRNSGTDVSYLKYTFYLDKKKLWTCYSFTNNLSPNVWAKKSNIEFPVTLVTFVGINNLPCVNVFTFVLIFASMWVFYVSK